MKRIIKRLLFVPEFQLAGEPENFAFCFSLVTSIYLPAGTRNMGMNSTFSGYRLFFKTIHGSGRAISDYKSN